MTGRIPMCKLRWISLAAVAVAVLLHASPALAQYQFCFGPTIQRSVPNPNLGDGVIEADNGWLNAFAYRGGNGTPDANIRLWGNTFQDGNHKWIALGVEASNDVQFDSGDAVVILYKIKNQNSYGQIVIAPLQNDQVPANIVNPRPGTSKYFSTTNPANWGASAASAPSWVTWGVTATTSGGACTAQNNGTSCKWTVEVGIDIAASGAPPDLESLYVDVVELTNRSPHQSRQFSWPPGNKLVDSADTTITPAPGTWGGVSVGSTSLCKGVSFGHDDITASPLNGGNLKADVEETFTVKLHNSGADAKGVIAHFAQAPFGICGLVESCFVPLGSTSTPTSCPNGATAPNCCNGTAACIPPDPTSAGTGLQVKWTPTNADEGHHCIRVKLEATVGDTTFVNQGDFHNMWVDHSSTVATQARINMKQVPAPIGGGKHRIQLASESTAQFAFADGTVPGIPIGTITAQIIRRYNGYRYTGQHVTVAGIRSEVWDPIGSYGFQLQHPMTADFQKTFVARNAGLIREHGGDADDEGAEPGKLRNLNAIRRVNAALAKHNERPAATDWKFRIDNAKVLPNTGGEVIEIEVPVDGELVLPTIATYGTDGGNIGCCPGASKTTPTASTLGMSMLVGAVLFRRRRQRCRH